MKKTVLIVLAVILLGAVILFATNNNSKPAPGNDDTTPSASDNDSSPQPRSGVEKSPAQTSPAEEAAATITYTDNGFEPSSVTVKSGDRVEVKNNSSKSMQFSSAPHPSHTQNRELNQNTLPPGGSQTFVVTTKGTWIYHDHLQASNTGTLVVE